MQHRQKRETGALRQLLERPDGRARLLKELQDDPAINEKILEIGLKARGYNNFQTGLVSGEAFMVQTVLAGLSVHTCLDVGAAQGQYSRMLLQQLPQSRVYGFDPLPSNHPILQALANAEPQRFSFWPWALGSSTAEAVLHFEASQPQLATLCEGVESIEYLNNCESVTVPVRSLDSIWLTSSDPEPLDFIKMDCEGWEADILDGAAATLRQLRPKALQLEFNRHHLYRGHTLLSLAQRLEDYSVYQLLPDHLAIRNPASILANIYQFSNFAFVRNDLVHLIEEHTR